MGVSTEHVKLLLLLHTASNHKQAVCVLYVAETNIPLEGNIHAMNFLLFSFNFAKFAIFQTNMKTTGYEFSNYDANDIIHIQDQDHKGLKGQKVRPDHKK